MVESIRSGPVLSRSLLLLPLALLLLGIPSACDEQGAVADELLSIRFPGTVAAGEAVTETVSLAQPLEFTFQAPPSDDLLESGFPVLVDSRGRTVAGQVTAEGTTLTFSPALPVQVEEEDSGSLAPHAAGLQPGETYSLRIDGQHVIVHPALEQEFLDAEPANGLLVTFQTTTEPEQYFADLECATPRLVAATPADGSRQVSPHLATDPDQQFDEPRPFELTFDAPVHPAQLERFQLVDLDDGARPLPSIASLEVQTLHSSVVRLVPTGPLTFGHMISVEYPTALVNLAAAPAKDDHADRHSIAAVVTVAAAGAGRVRDYQVEGFDDVSPRAPEPEPGPGYVEAEWNAAGSGLLTAAYSTGGSGFLGRFIPSAANPHTIRLDTDSQEFPLPDGSTPDAPPVVVKGGVFPFTRIDIPDGITLTALGHRPLVLQATESCRLAGQVQLEGGTGHDDFSFDSAIWSITGGAGGAGGGRGGVGHPLRYLPGGIGAIDALIDPEFGGRGYGPGNHLKTGGHGGQCGMLDQPDANGDYITDGEINCSELTDAHNNGYKIPGGGGGSMLAPGTAPQANGTGNVIVGAIPGHYKVRTPADGPNYNVLLGGQPGEPVFADGDAGNDYLGAGGEHGFLGGQGGGGGGSGLDSYYCGNWCKIDQDPTNDLVCFSEFGNPARFADSVGDSRGGGGGGGGGGFVIEAAHTINLMSTAVIDCSGGRGGGGEALGCGNWAGQGGGGSGGAVVLRAGGHINVDPGAVLDVAGGNGKRATGDKKYQVSCQNMSRSHPGAGGNGGDGLIQMELLAGDQADVDAGAKLTEGAWVDPQNRRNPVVLGSTSVAVSGWRDLGRAARDPDGPFLHVRGLDPRGFVPTDERGSVLDHQLADFRVAFDGVEDPRRAGHYLPGLEPRGDWVPPGTAIRVEFQGAAAIAEGSREIDPDSKTVWSADPAIADGLHFVRFRVTFDLAVDGDPVTPQTPRPSLESLRMVVDY